MIGVYYLSHQKKQVILPKDTTILAFGDSLTYGTGASSASKSYPAVLQKMLGVKVINEGIAGEISENGLKRLEKILQKSDPDILILCHGGNDILRRYDLKKMRQNIESMVTLAQQKNIKVILIAVPKLNGIFISSASMYEKIAKKMNIKLENDVLEDIINDVNLKSDQVHPNDKGYEKMAKAIKKVILNE